MLAGLGLRCDSRDLTLQILMSDAAETVRSAIDAHSGNATSQATLGWLFDPLPQQHEGYREDHGTHKDSHKSETDDPADHTGED
jgi:hypothetical protein